MKYSFIWKGFFKGFTNNIYRKSNIPLNPVWANFEVTDACNSRCKTCNIWKNKPTKNLLKPDEIFNVFTDPTLRNLKRVVLTGGEPTLRKDLENVIDAINQALPKTEIHMTTNGLLPQRVLEIVNFINKRKINFHIHLSLDGLRRLHDHIRGVKGNFEKVDYLTHELRKYRSSLFDFHVGSVLSELNYFALEEIQNYAKGLGIPLRVQIYELSDYFYNINNPISPFQINLLEALKALTYNPYYKICQHVLKTGKYIKFPCYALFTFFTMRCNGDIVTCMRKYWNHSVGNLRENSFTEIWNGAKAVQARNIVKRCSGCLDACEVTWSLSSCYFYLFKTILEKHV